MNSITAIIEIEKGLNDSLARKKLLAAMADTRGSTGAMIAASHAFLLSGKSEFEEKFEKAWQD